MAKSIVFCADGTWNGPGQGEEQGENGGRRTNVYKLFLNLDGALAPGTRPSAEEQERILSGPGGRVTQVAKYLHGVGDSQNFLVRVLGGGGGAGLVTRIVRGYTFISRNFEPGDRIFIVGFSRGAYTARALAGLIAARGLLDPKQNDLSDHEQAYRLGSAEWFTYRRGALRTKPNLLHRLAEVAVDLPRFLSSESTAARIPDVSMEAVVVWDTVGALGIPAYNLRTDTQLDAFQFADLVLSDKVRHGLHAVSIDEQRANFTPTLCDPDSESGLSDCALQWVTNRLTALGVAFAARPTVTLKPDPCGKSHTPWADAPWNVLPRGSRQFPAGLVVHRSVVERLAGVARLPAPYKPSNLMDYLDEGRLRTGVPIAD